MTVGDHFELVASVYDSLRTTDEAPVRKLCELRQAIAVFLAHLPVPRSAGSMSISWW